MPLPPPPNAPSSTLPEGTSATPIPPPPAFPTASDRPPTDFTARPNRFVTALSLTPERPPLQANPWGALMAVGVGPGGAPAHAHRTVHSKTNICRLHAVPSVHSQEPRRRPHPKGSSYLHEPSIWRHLVAAAAMAGTCARSRQPHPKAEARASKIRNKTGAHELL